MKMTKFTICLFLFLIYVKVAEVLFGKLQKKNYIHFTSLKKNIQK